MTPRKRLARISPKGNLIRWRGNFYTRRDIGKVILGSLIDALFPRRADGVPIPLTFIGSKITHGSFISSVNSSWTVPFGTNSITIEVWGGGGGGGANVSGGCKGGSGGHGGYQSSTISVSYGQVISWTTGAGGAVGTAGQTTSCAGVSAAGGAAGTNAAQWTWNQPYWTRDAYWLWQGFYCWTPTPHWGALDAYNPYNINSYWWSPGPSTCYGSYLHYRYTLHYRAVQSYSCPNGVTNGANPGAGGAGGVPGGTGQVRITW